MTCQVVIERVLMVEVRVREEEEVDVEKAAQTLPVEEGDREPVAEEAEAARAVEARVVEVDEERDEENYHSLQQ